MIKMKTKIIRNIIKCKNCGDILESTHVHDFKMCKCGDCGVEGGHDYLRRLFRTDNSYIELSETEEIDE